MAGSYNHIVLVGRLTKNPEIRYIQSGNAVTSFSIAVNRRSKQGDEAMFVDCVAWNGQSRKLADICNDYLKKGMTVLVDGRLAIREYTNKDGEKRKATEVVVNDMQMLDSKNAGGTNGGGSYGGGDRDYASSKAGSGTTDDAEAAVEDEIPF
ncbi:MAG: single-stranded DNA-binding protein [Candidatus Eremiobacteraeota bacterium]|nr:single-stranded DNA-binding protein [Candidatus Eremiobacteraeota bacterium]MBC5801410.1 single-stranded DNA-binding protein [Candidatus Eremiobacteraeota bacterium]MBC5825529.1 single-stranded DNA-binding protein [Candidatus Eremiobacteraeota bacterium]